MMNSYKNKHTNNTENGTEIETEHRIPHGQLDQSEVLNRVIKSIRNLRTLSGMPLDDVKFYDNSNGSHNYVYFVVSNTLKRIDNNIMSNYKKSFDSKRLDFMKFVEIRGAKLMIIGRFDRKFKAQANLFALPSTIIDMINKTCDIISSVTTTGADLVNKTTSTAKAILTHEFKLFILDVFSFLLKLKDMFFTPYTIIGLLINLYTLQSRYTAIFKPQAGPTSFDIIFGTATLLGMPDHIMNHIKNFTALTGKRLFDSELILDAMEKILSSVIAIVEWVAKPFGYSLMPDNITEMIVSTIRCLGSSVFMHARIKRICSQYTLYVADSSRLFDPAFREQCMNTYNDCKADSIFNSYITNNNNKYFITTWNLYERNLIKSCKAFQETSRDEPLCFVFEGAAGSGKSTIMNKFIDLLRSRGLTTYCHSVPATMDGKDFYDDYENQDIFVMDDVGQQGNSQWRYIINYVSPVKYPLPCASADKKNTKFFNSKYIFCTTNHFRTINSFTSSDCISEPEALFRRCHVIDVKTDRSDNFKQEFQYYKFDHLDSHKWENRLIHHFTTTNPNILINFNNQDLTFNNFSFNNKTDAVLAKLYALFAHIKHSHESEKAKVSKDPDVQILDKIDEMFASEEAYFDASDEIDNPVSNDTFLFQPQSGIKPYAYQALYTMTGFAIGYFGFDYILRELNFYYFDMIVDRIKYFINLVYTYIFQSISGNVVNIGLAALGIAFGAGVLWYLKDYFLGSKTEEIDLTKLEVPNEHIVWHPQNGLPERITTLAKFCKTVSIRDATGIDQVLCQCVVSGNRLLLPAHVVVEDRFVDLYATYEHYTNRHVEHENLRLKQLKVYVSCDLAVYEIMDSIPLYKLNRNIFNKSACNNPNWYLVNSSGTLPVLLNKNIVRNDAPVEYSTVIGKMYHPAGTGMYTPYSAWGGCGTVLANTEGGIVGFHVAGSNNLGFCVVPSDAIGEEIRELLLKANHAEFELDDRIIPDFSGVRIRYAESDKPDVQYISGKTDLVQTGFHVDYNEDMRNLIEDIIVDPTLNPTREPKIDVKVPPNYASAGNPTRTLKKMAAKTFRRQGTVTAKEMSFLKDYLRTLMVRFDDLSDEETAFGGDYVKPLNKDSSNGYGCLKGKNQYFDFEQKIIRDEAKRLFADFKDCALEKNYSDYSKYMCRETFKDELRMPEKADKPRTFRVMPLGHIWWTKKIFGKLVKHFKSTKHETGIGVGFNPYKDFDILMRKLKQCAITGDIDFGKWDGSILALFMMLIAEVFTEFYDGDNQEVIHFLFVTMSKSFVLIADEIWATTHGLPSGTWLTLLINCLLNKLLTALVIFRNKPDATVSDVSRVVDYVMGDDKIIGAPADMAEYFNLHTIRDVAESLGMECTNGDKTPITEKSHPFHKLSFVKRTVNMHPYLNRYVGALSLETLTSTLMWRFSDRDEVQVMEGKMRSVLVEAYLHSPALAARFRRLFERLYPFAPLLDDNRILQILDSDQGYAIVMQGLGKDYLY